MTAIHCPFCPLAGCIWCEHKGGETTETQGNPGARQSSRTPENGKVSLGNKTAPEDAPTSTPGPRPIGTAKSHDRT